MKKIYFIIFIACIGFTSCKSVSILDLNRKETLIATQYKTIENGHLIFIVYMNDIQVKEMNFSYSIDIKDKTVSCSKSSEKVYAIRDKEDYLKSLRLKTAEGFKKSQQNTWREKYYICFSDNFLSMSNNEKINLLNINTSPVPLDMSDK